MGLIHSLYHRAQAHALPYITWAYAWTLGHRVLAGVLALGVALGGWYGFLYLTATEAETTYVPARVALRDIATVVSGSGQVSAGRTVDLKTTASGTVVYVGVSAGQTVARGATIVQLGASDAQKAVRDAQANLESAQLGLKKLTQPPTALELLQVENALVTAQESKKSAEDDLEKAYVDAYSAVVSAYLDVPGIITGLENILYTKSLNGNVENIGAYATMAINSGKDMNAENGQLNVLFRETRTLYEGSFAHYRTASRTDSREAIVALTEDAHITATAVADLVKATSNYIDAVEDAVTRTGGNWTGSASAHQTSLGTYASQTNIHVSALLSALTAIDTRKEAVVSAERAIREREESLAELNAGTDSIDLESQQLTVRQRQNALRDAQEALADYYVRAPFAGIVSLITTFRGETLGSSTTVGSLVTEDLVVSIELNEVDAVQVEPGQSVLLTFDALNDLEVVGEVSAVDAVGTVTQGVVSYGVDIALTQNDARIKPGMSVSAEITTVSKTAVLAVPNSAVHFEGERAYVETIAVPEDAGDRMLARGITSTTMPERVFVTSGIADDVHTEILEGLAEGVYVVEKTKTTTEEDTQTSGTSLFQFGGGRPPGGR